MAEEKAVACSLGAGELHERLAAIAELGEEALIGRSTDGGTHLLRFRGDPATRERLERIVAAEARCCPFLELTLRDDRGELVLSIGASAEAEAFAAELAVAFEP